jgi:hypothetical protein
MVSSTVYGLEEMLNQVYAALNSYGYRVWMSHAGTIPVHPRKSNFQNCIWAVENCDVFLGVITVRYGSGRSEKGLSITHREMLRAIQINKPAWFLVNHDVVVARQLLKQFRFTKHRPPRRKKGFVFEPTPVLDDLRILDMYEAAMRGDVPLAERTGNWVQEYINTPDVLRFLEAQFSDAGKLTAFLSSYGTREANHAR